MLSLRQKWPDTVIIDFGNVLSSSVLTFNLVIEIYFEAWVWLPWSQRFFLIFLSERDQEQAAKKTSRKTSGTRVRFGGISNFSNNGISANCLSVRTKNRAFSAKLKISQFVTAQEVPLPACRRLLFPLCNTKEIGDVYTQARSSRAAKEIGDV